MTKETRYVILGVTGSIAAYKACEIVNLLKKEAFDVTVLMTEEAAKFITPLTLETLSGNRVILDMFEPPQTRDPVHISLADKADVIVVAPATANIIGRLANGICDSLLTCVIFAAKSPIAIAPAMNSNMYNHRIVRANIERLKDAGYKFIGPVKGHLACGREDMGHIAQPMDIVNEVKRLAK